MRVKVRPLRLEGIDLHAKQWQSIPPHEGELRVLESRDPKLSRQVTRARLVTPSTETDVLPELIDARLLWAGNNQMRLTGFEQVGAINYAQTWSVELG